MSLNIKKIENYNAVLREISPFGKKYVLFSFGFIVLLISISLPINEYHGITIVGQSNSLNTKHRILFETLNFLIIFINIYMYLSYKIKGFSRSLIRDLISYYRSYVHLKKSRYSFFQFFIVILFSYFIFLLGILFIDPGAPSRYGWFYHGFIYFSMIYACLIYYVFTVFFAVILAMNEMKKYL